MQFAWDSIESSIDEMLFAWDSIESSLDPCHGVAPVPRILTLQGRWHIPNQNFGAVYRCRSANFCPYFVLCPEFVHFLSYDCPVLDYFLSLSCFWLLYVTKLPTFVQISSSYCPPFHDWSNFCPFIVHTSDTNSGKKQKTKASQKLDRGISFFFHLVTLQLDKHWTILGLLFVQCLSTYLPKS